MRISYEKFIDILDELFLIAGVVFLFLGFSGLIIIITSYPIGMFGDMVLDFAASFIYVFMSGMGIFLILFHKKIIVKPKEHY